MRMLLTPYIFTIRVAQSGLIQKGKVDKIMSISSQSKRISLKTTIFRLLSFWGFMQMIRP